MKKVPEPYLYHIRDAIKNIETFLKDIDQNQFYSDKMCQNAVIRELEVIGEACSSLEEQFTKSHPQIPWRDIKDFRNKLIHEYWKVDLEIVWLVATKDLPKLKTQILHLLKKT